MAIKQIDTKFIEQQDRYIKQQLTVEIEVGRRGGFFIDGRF